MRGGSGIIPIHTMLEQRDKIGITVSGINPIQCCVASQEDKTPKTCVSRTPCREKKVSQPMVLAK
jgi:hypothetical protein